MANIILRLSTGSSATTNSDPTASLGGQMASNPEAIITTSSSSLNNLFDNITKAENFNGTTDYRCIYIHNDTANAGEIFAEGELYISGTPYADISIAIGQKNVTAPTVVNENTPPSGLTFTKPTSGSPLKLMLENNTLNAGDRIPVWIKRTAANITGSGTVTDVISLAVRGIE